MKLNVHCQARSSNEYRVEADFGWDGARRHLSVEHRILFVEADRNIAHSISPSDGGSRIRPYALKYVKDHTKPRSRYQAEERQAGQPRIQAVLLSKNDRKGLEQQVDHPVNKAHFGCARCHQHVGSSARGGSEDEL